MTRIALWMAVLGSAACGHEPPLALKPGPPLRLEAALLDRREIGAPGETGDGVAGARQLAAIVSANRAGA